MVIIKSIDTVLKQDEEQLNTEKGYQSLSSFIIWTVEACQQRGSRKILKNLLSGYCGRIKNDFLVKQRLSDDVLKVLEIRDSCLYL